MKKEYVKPTLLVLTTEPSQIMATSPGSDEGGMGGVVEGEDTGLEGGVEDNLEPIGSKGGLWDEYTW